MNVPKPCLPCDLLALLTFPIWGALLLLAVVAAIYLRVACRS